MVVIALAGLLVTALAASAQAPEDFTLDKRAPPTSGSVLSDGSCYKSGSISSTVRWQASGILRSGGCPKSVKISKCFQIYLPATGMTEQTTCPARRSTITDALELAALYDDHLDDYFTAYPKQVPDRFPNSVTLDSDGNVLSKRQVVQDCGGGGGTDPDPTAPPPVERQRIEFLTWPGAVAGRRYRYTWRSYLVPGISTSASFNHLMQVLRRDACGGPVITLDVKADRAVISDTVRGCTNCASIPLKSFQGKTLLHTMTITYGISGAVDYAIVDVARPKVTLLSYKATGDMGSSASLKFGMYRKALPGMTEGTSYVGDLKATKLA